MRYSYIRISVNQNSFGLSFRVTLLRDEESLTLSGPFPQQNIAFGGVLWRRPDVMEMD